MAPKVNGNEIHALKIRVRMLSESLERLERRDSEAGGRQSDVTTADEGMGKGMQKKEPTLAPPIDGRLMKANHTLRDSFKELFTQYLAADAGTEDSRPEGGDKAEMPPSGERRARDSATAEAAEGKLDGKAAKRPAPSDGFVRDIRPTEADLEELLPRLYPQ